MFDSLQDVLEGTYNSAFCGLHATRPFKIAVSSAQEFFTILVEYGIRFVSTISGESIIFSYFTTGISIAKPFDKDQV
jgi:hypothetical protein